MRIRQVQWLVNVYLSYATFRSLLCWCADQHELKTNSHSHCKSKCLFCMFDPNLQKVKQASHSRKIIKFYLKTENFIYPNFFIIIERDVTLFNLPNPVKVISLVSAETTSDRSNASPGIVLSSTLNRFTLNMAL